MGGRKEGGRARKRMRGRHTCCLWREDMCVQVRRKEEEARWLSGRNFGIARPLTRQQRHRIARILWMTYPPPLISQSNDPSEIAIMWGGDGYLRLHFAVVECEEARKKETRRFASMSGAE